MRTRILRLNRGAVPVGALVTIGVVVAIAALGYALYLLTTMTGELARMSAKLDGLKSMGTGIDRLSDRLDLLEETNRRLAMV